MNLNGSPRLRPGNLGCAKREVGRHAIKVTGDRSESQVYVTRCRARALSTRVDRCAQRGEQRKKRDQAHSLMDLQHVRSLVEWIEEADPSSPEARL